MTTPGTDAETRSAAPDDLPALAAFIARTNAAPASQSLYCTAGTSAGIRAALRDPENFPDGWERAFAIAVRSNGEIVAAAGCQSASGGAHGWLWGPWVGAERDWTTLAPRLLDQLTVELPTSVVRLEGFLHADNHGAQRFLRSRGFSAGPPTRIYVRRQAGWTPLPGDGSPLRPAHEVAFARLHAETFPVGASTPADALLAGRDDEHAIFAIVDGLRLLGYVCVSVNHAPREGFVDYLAVRAAARGRGVGARLLQTALRWTFESKQLPQAALCVSEWRAGARVLYERAGFVHHATGIGLRGGF